MISYESPRFVLDFLYKELERHKADLKDITSKIEELKKRYEEKLEIIELYEKIYNKEASLAQEYGRNNNNDHLVFTEGNQKQDEIKNLLEEKEGIVISSSIRKNNENINRSFEESISESIPSEDNDQEENKNDPPTDFLKLKYQQISMNEIVEDILSKAGEPVNTRFVVNSAYDIDNQDNWIRARNSMGAILRIGAQKGRWKKAGRGLYADNSVETTNLNQKGQNPNDKHNEFEENDFQFRNSN